MDSEAPTTDDARTAREATLRSAVLEGDTAAWRVLYGRAFAPLYRYALFRTKGDEASAEEALQETWMIAVRTLRRFDPRRASFETWLRAIAANVLRNQGRKRARHAGFPLDEGAAATLAPDGLELAEQISATMTALPSNYQDVLRERYEEQRSMAEIAAERGTTPKAIESLLGRARAAFRAAYVRLDPASREERR